LNLDERRTPLANVLASKISIKCFLLLVVGLLEYAVSRRSRARLTYVQSWQQLVLARSLAADVMLALARSLAADVLAPRAAAIFSDLSPCTAARKVRW
jgi:hypothetical protein